jgi:uncharacterized protein (UPF0261 family)
MPTVAVVGTWDTKGSEHRYLADRIRASGADVVLIHAGVAAADFEVDVDHAEVAAAAGTTVEALAGAGDRSSAIAAMGRGAGIILRQLHDAGRLDGAVTLGGGGGTTLASIAMRELPVGVPKLIVSTIAAGDTRPLIGGTDLTLMYSVLDIAGLNAVSRRILDNAAAAIAGMAAAPGGAGAQDRKPMVGATMFGVTTAALQAARVRLEAHGYEVLVFHATGSGGQSLEALARAGYLSGVLDLTTTELADDLVGGVMSAGPDRLTAAGQAGVPQVVSVGALDMVNLGPLASIAPQFRERHLIEHVPTMTLMRTTAEECTELGHRIAERVSRAKGPAVVFLPLKGVSAIATAGGPFHDADADEALFAAIRERAAPNVPIVELDLGANDESFGEAMADQLIRLMNVSKEEESHDQPR